MPGMKQKAWIALQVISVVCLFSFTVRQFKPDIVKMWDLEKIKSILCLIRPFNLFKTINALPFWIAVIQTGKAELDIYLFFSI